MSNNENKAAREDVRQGRRGVTETAENMPLVSAKRGKFDALENTKIEALVFQRLTEYKAFVAEVEGEEPEAGAIVSAGLEMLFDADKGFERWSAEQRKKNRNGAGATNNGNANGVRSHAPVAAAIGAGGGQEKK